MGPLAGSALLTFLADTVALQPDSRLNVEVENRGIWSLHFLFLFICELPWIDLLPNSGCATAVRFDLHCLWVDCKGCVVWCDHTALDISSYTVSSQTLSLLKKKQFTKSVRFYGYIHFLRYNMNLLLCQTENLIGQFWSSGYDFKSYIWNYIIFCSIYKMNENWDAITFILWIHKPFYSAVEAQKLKI